MRIYVEPVLEIRPITLADAKWFVKLLHRHNDPPVGHKFSVACYRNSELVGVAMAGRPIARMIDSKRTLEVNRTCTDGSRNVNSMLYAAVWRAAKALGYLRCITYIQGEETGASLKAAGWIKVRDLPARGSWAECSVQRKDKQDPVGTGGVARQLWHIEVKH